MKSKHEQLYVAVQDLLIELGITPKMLKLIVTDEGCMADCAASRVTTKTAQKLIDADLITEEINWKQSGNVFGPYQKSLDLLAFDAIKSRVIPGIFWEYLQEAHSEFLQIQVAKLQKNSSRPIEDYPLTTFNKIKSHLAPIILWEYLREKHPEFLSEQIKEYLFPTQ